MRQLFNVAILRQRDNVNTLYNSNQELGQGKEGAGSNRPMFHWI